MERASTLICTLVQSCSTPSTQNRNLGVYVENVQGVVCLFLVAVQDLCDVSSRGSRCQGISCCVAGADICRSKEPWPKSLFMQEREREPYTTLYFMSSVLISLTHIYQNVISSWLQLLWAKRHLLFSLDIWMYFKSINRHQSHSDNLQLPSETVLEQLKTAVCVLTL